MSTPPVTRQDVVHAARQWLDTTYHHQGRLRGVGVDCVGLVIGVARDLGLVPAGFDVAPYPRTPDGTSLLHLAELHMEPLPVGEVLEPGHVVVVRFDQEPQHLGIAGDYRHGGLSLIHSVARPGRVIETRLMFSRAMRFVAAFRLPGVA